MPTNELVDKYFLQPGDVTDSTWIPSTHEGCKVTTLVDPVAYFTELKTELAKIGSGANAEANPDQFFYMIGWWPDLLGTTYEPPIPFSLDGPDGARLIDVLKDKAARGVDVRVMVDISYMLLDFQKFWQKHPHIRKILRLSDERVMESIGPNVYRYQTLMAVAEDLRAGGVKCCLNAISHAAGGTHSKFVLIGRRAEPGSPITAVGFTGGVDLRFDRYDRITHPTPRPYAAQVVGWHDVVAKVEGPALSAFYQDFLQMWNEVLERKVQTYRFPDPPRKDVTTYKTCKTVAPDTDPVPARTLSSESIGTHYVQSVRTVPAANYKGLFGRLARHWGAKAASFAPNGLFTGQLAWQKAISAAEHYIYMEDWGYWCEDVMVWINAEIKDKPNLKVIMVQGHDDPNDNEYPPLLIFALWKLLFQLTDEQKDRIRFHRRLDVQVHSKTTLIDDEWTIIGSTVCCRRSLYTDFEHSMVVVDPDRQLVKGYRRTLWGDHFGEECPDDRDAAISKWFTGTLPSPPFVSLTLNPSPKLIIGSRDAAGERTEYVVPQEQVGEYVELYDKLSDRYTDPDSREPWGDFPIKDV